MARVEASNSNELLSEAAQQGAVTEDCTHISLWDGDRIERNGRPIGRFLESNVITNNPDQLSLGERFRISIGGLVLTQPVATSGVLLSTLTMAERAIRGKILGGVWVQFHKGDPGPDGTAMQITDMARLAIPQDDWTITQVPD